MRKGLTEQEATEACGDLSLATVLPPEQIAALKLADVLTEQGTPSMTPEVMAELDDHFSKGQILELATALSVASGWQRFIEAFGIRPDYWSESTPLPERPDDCSEHPETS